MNYKYLTGLLAIALLFACSEEKTSVPVPVNTNQMILVVTPDMDVPGGQLQRFERNAAGIWEASGDPIPTMIGKNGLGWGIGLHPEVKDGVLKKEGDGKAPAGVFILSRVFGFLPIDSLNVTMPYTYVSEAVECVDDVESKYYNMILIRRDIWTEPEWNSSEKMLAVGEQYALGVTVDHNPERIPGRGSCIFLHIWGGIDDPTIGCTSVDADNMQRIAEWLDPQANPVLVQLAKPDYQQLKEKWQLPAITVED